MMCNWALPSQGKPFKGVGSGAFEIVTLFDTNTYRTVYAMLVLEKRNLKQPEVSNLMNGRYTLFSQERLFGFLNKLGQKVTVKVSPHRHREKPPRDCLCLM